MEFEAEDMESVLRDWRDEESDLLEFGSERVTIFTPRPSLLLAGMKSVVCPSLRLSAVRRGWRDEQQPFRSSSVDVE
jgi:hypothetical protein